MPTANCNLAQSRRGNNERRGGAWYEVAKLYLHNSCWVRLGVAQLDIKPAKAFGPTLRVNVLCVHGWLTGYGQRIVTFEALREPVLVLYQQLPR